MSDSEDPPSVVRLRFPDSDEALPGFELGGFMGTWYVTHSTLPMWKSRKDVTISYTLMSSSAGQPIQFEDVVEYRSKNDLPTSKRSRIVGIDTLLPSSLAPRPAGTAASSERAAETRFKWRGKGWLFIASSRWHILGCSATAHPADSPSGRPEWALTSFEKTAFTPAGLDIYSRTPEGLPAALLEEIIHRAKALGGDVGKLAEQFFEVGRSAS